MWKKRWEKRPWVSSVFEDLLICDVSFPHHFVQALVIPETLCWWADSDLFILSEDHQCIFLKTNMDQTKSFGNVLKSDFWPSNPWTRRWHGEFWGFRTVRKDRQSRFWLKKWILEYPRSPWTFLSTNSTSQKSGRNRFREYLHKYRYRSKDIHEEILCIQNIDRHSWPKTVPCFEATSSLGIWG